MGCCCSADLEPTLGEHSTLPDDVIPYNGPSLQYAFVEMRVIGTTSFGRSLKTDLVPHYASFEGPYAHGFRIIGLKTVPGSFEKLKVQYGMERRYYIPYEAAFVKPVGSPHAPVGQMKVVQTAVEFTESLSKAKSRYDVQLASEVAHLREFDAEVEENGREGFQLVSFEPSAYRKKTTNVNETVVEFNMVFHRSHQPESFVYQSVIIPVTYAAIGNLPVTGRRLYELASDLSPRLNEILQQGWKIVDTNYLSSHLQGQFRPRDTNITFNSLWVFEKPSAAANDTRPRWECMIIKYKHIIKQICNGTAAATTWKPLLIEMGHRGWELACILDTAEAAREGRCGVRQMLLLVFQRPLL